MKDFDVHFPEREHNGKTFLLVCQRKELSKRKGKNIHPSEISLRCFTKLTMKCNISETYIAC